jgi:GntR family transcriptional regulator, rspAB operon transcriptional repressor
MPLILKPKKIEKESEVDRVYRLLKSALLQCEFAPGDFLGEVDLARQCQTSRTPVREACTRLCHEGWISQIRFRGYMVPTISVREIVELYEYRKVLECFTAGRVAEIATDAQLADLAAMIKVERDPNPKLRELVEVNEVFHLAVAAAAENQRILDQLKLLLEQVHRLDILGTQKDTGWIPHQDVLETLKAHNPGEARRTMAAHIDSSRDRMLKLFGG